MIKIYRLMSFGLYNTETCQKVYDALTQVQMTSIVQHDDSITLAKNELPLFLLARSNASQYI